MPAAALAAAFLTWGDARVCPVTLSKPAVSVEPGRTATFREVESIPPPIVTLHWVPQSGFYSDVVRGSLSALRESEGDFRAALEGCIGEDRGGGTLDDAALPLPGDGFWYLVRSDQRDGCPGGVDGSYDSPGPPQVADRDLGILSSGRACHCFMADMGYGCFQY